MRWNEQKSGPAAIHRHAWVWQSALSLVVVGIVGTLAFGRLFTTFVPWDDEGYFFQTYRQFLSGRILYDQIATIYGPLTFFCSAAVARFDANNVTHDAFRWAWLLAWILIDAVLAGVVWRWTGRFAPSLVTFLVVGCRLKGLAKGVGHPQLWIILAAAVMLWLGLDWAFEAGGLARAFWMGTVIGAVFLFKINIGIYVFVGLALALSLHLKGRFGLLAGAVLALAAGALCAVSLVVTSSVGERYFVVAYLFSIIATVAVAMTQGNLPRLRADAMIWLAIGFCVSLCAGVFLTLATGTTLRSLYISQIVMPRQFVAAYHYPFLDPAGKKSLLLCGLAGIVAGGFVGLRWLTKVRPQRVGLLKFVAGFGLLCGLWYDNRMALTGSLLFLWLLIADWAPRCGSGYSNRLLLALLSAVFSLQLFPMAGEQVDWASLMPIAAAGVLLADGLNLLRQESTTTFLPWRTAFIARSMTTLLLIGVFAYAGRMAVQSGREWNRSRPLDFLGAHWLRLPLSEQGELVSAVTAIDRNCQELLTIPRMPSFNLWSRIPMLETHSITPEDIRESELRDLSRRNQGCVLVSPSTYSFWQGMVASRRADTLLQEIQRTMSPIVSTPNLTLYLFSATSEASPDRIIERNGRTKRW